MWHLLDMLLSLNQFISIKSRYNIAYDLKPHYVQTPAVRIPLSATQPFKLWRVSLNFGSFPFTGISFKKFWGTFVTYYRVITLHSSHMNFKKRDVNSLYVFGPIYGFHYTLADFFAFGTKKTVAIPNFVLVEIFKIFWVNTSCCSLKVNESV